MILIARFQLRDFDRQNIDFGPPSIDFGHSQSIPIVTIKSLVTMSFLTLRIYAAQWD